MPGMTALVSSDRRACDNGGATGRLRLDVQLAAYQLQAFLHAGQAESQASIRRVGIEASTCIMNGESDRVPGSAKLHIEMPGAAVPHCVLQRFLEDSEEAK